MISSKNNRGASAAIVVIAILFLALMATLGVVFYQNFIQKPQSTQTNTSTNSSAVQTSELKTQRVAFHTTIYALDYPASWNATSKKVANTTDDTDSYLESPDGEVRIRFSIASSGVGGTCDTNSALKITDYAVTSSINTKLTGQPLALVEALYDHPQGGYDYKIGMTEDSGATHTAVGSVYCTVLYTGIASSLQLSSDAKTVVRPLIIAEIHFPKLDSQKGAAAPSMQVIKDLMNSDSYKAAVRTLESARKE